MVSTPTRFAGFGRETAESYERHNRTSRAAERVRLVASRPTGPGIRLSVADVGQRTASDPWVLTLEQCGRFLDFPADVHDSGRKAGAP